MTCRLGVGCDEYGVCYAEAHGRSDQCGQDSPLPVCRNCGVAYGYERIVPHREGCEYERAAGVCASDCDWPS